MKETTVVRPPTAATMRLDGGHPALELVNTVYGQAGGPVEHDVLATPQDLLTLARRLGFADARTPPGRDALADARDLRDVLDTLLRARVAHAEAPESAVAAFTAAVRDALAAAQLAPEGDALAWGWDPRDARTPVHRLAHAALGLLTAETELARLHQCAGCCWLFLDHSRGAGRRWCSMADCGTEAKKRRYVERRRRKRQTARCRPGR
jgi:predicted RNA-binding Zn ribbon-like protein